MRAGLQNKVDFSRITIDRLPGSLFKQDAISADIIRLDRMHPVISGNKWFKLQYYLQEAVEKSHSMVLSFGGAYSNHILALACAAQQTGIPSMAIVRGEQASGLSHTLDAAAAYGMQLRFANRVEYKQKENPEFIQQLQEQYPGVLIIPEGGAGELGIRGSATMLPQELVKNYTHLLCAVGTGTMFRGIARGLITGQELTGIMVLKIAENESTKPKAWLKQLLHTPGSKLLFDYHFGGYAKKNSELIHFMNEWYDETGIPTDFVYTAKLCFAFHDLVQKNYFPTGSRILLVHSGGLQGNDSLAAGTLNF